MRNRHHWSTCRLTPRACVYCSCCQQTQVSRASSDAQRSDATGQHARYPRPAMRSRYLTPCSIASFLNLKASTAEICESFFKEFSKQYLFWRELSHQWSERSSRLTCTTAASCRYQHAMLASVGRTVPKEYEIGRLACIVSKQRWPASQSLAGHHKDSSSVDPLFASRACCKRQGGLTPDTDQRHAGERWQTFMALKRAWLMSRTLKRRQATPSSAGKQDYQDAKLHAPTIEYSALHDVRVVDATGKPLGTGLIFTTIIDGRSRTIIGCEIRRQAPHGAGVRPVCPVKNKGLPPKDDGGTD